MHRAQPHKTGHADLRALKEQTEQLEKIRLKHMSTNGGGGGGGVGERERETDRH